MKKIFTFMLLILLFGITYSDIDLTPKDSSGKSIWYASIIPTVYLAYGSHESSEASTSSFKNNDQETVAIYDHYKVLAQNKRILADEIFSAQGLTNYGLKSKDVVKLDETNIGLLVSHNGKGIAFIPSKLSNGDLLKRDDR